MKFAAEGHEYVSTKTYNHNVGLSCAFRQWRAESHCRFIHGYALKVHFEFTGVELDVRNWLVDFGGLKPLKAMLEDALDHKTLVAEDDPDIAWFREAELRGILQLVEVPSAGCEATARLIFEVTEQWLKDAGYGERIILSCVQVAEHDGNSAMYRRKK
jgi:6-pyruvoyltetrahydropterin/6-carboxytetrahydropterin synthase